MRDDGLTADEMLAECAVALPDKEVVSILDLNVDVDVFLDAAAPIDLAAAAQLNVAAPIDAAASANVLSTGSTAVSEVNQTGTLDQILAGNATATSDQFSIIDQSDRGRRRSRRLRIRPTTAAPWRSATLPRSSGPLLNVDVNVDLDADLAAPIAGRLRPTPTWPRRSAPASPRTSCPPTPSRARCRTRTRSISQALYGDAERHVDAERHHRSGHLAAWQRCPRAGVDRNGSGFVEHSRPVTSAVARSGDAGGSTSGDSGAPLAVPRTVPAGRVADAVTAESLTHQGALL